MRKNIFHAVAIFTILAFLPLGNLQGMARQDRTEEESRDEKRALLSERPSYEKRDKESADPDVRALQIEQGLIDPGPGE